MFVDIELGESIDAQERGKQQGLKASPQGLITVMQEGKVVTGMGFLVDGDGLLELRHYGVEGTLLIEPVLKEMHAHIGQTGLDADDAGAGGRRPMTGGMSRASLGSTKLPLTSQAVEMTDTDVKRRMALGDLVEHEPTGAQGLFMKQV
jgi:hypothetical protein